MKSKRITRDISIAACAAALAVCVQAIHLPKIITAIFINTIFLTVYFKAGKQTACSVACITPLAAALTHILPAFMLPVLPVIILGNVVYVLMFHILKSRQKYLKILAASLSKALIIGILAYIVMNFIEIDKLRPLFHMYLVIQFVTAFLGGICAEILRTRI